MKLRGTMLSVRRNIECLRCARDCTPESILQFGRCTAGVLELLNNMHMRLLDNAGSLTRLIQSELICPQPHPMRCHVRSVDSWRFLNMCVRRVDI